jgi:hypothetical protein
MASRVLHRLLDAAIENPAATYLIGIAAILVILILTFLGVLAGLVACAGVVIGSLPWTYDKIRAREAESRLVRRLQISGSAMFDVVRDRLPAFTNPDAAGLSWFESWCNLAASNLVRSHRLEETDDVVYLQEIADLTIARVCNDYQVSHFGSEPFRILVIYLSEGSLDRGFGDASKRIVRTFVGEQLQFLPNGVTLRDQGETFAKTLTFLETVGRVDKLELLEEWQKRPLDSSQSDRVALQLADPQLSFIVFELGKAEDLVGLLRQRMSGKRIVSKLTTRMKRKSTGQSSRFRSFLVLKQEKKLGDRYFKNRINAVDNRIVSAGTLYHGHEPIRFQSVSVLTLPYSSGSARAFFKKHFPDAESLPSAEAAKAGLVAVPLATDDAFYFPEDVSVLDEPQQDFFQRWATLLRRDQQALREIISDFEVDFLELVQVLTLDFLVKRLSRGERNYLRKNSDRILAAIGAKNLLQVGEVPIARLSGKMKEIGYPEYSKSDRMSFIEYLDLSEQGFLEARMEELAESMVHNAKQIGLLSHH